MKRLGDISFSDLLPHSIAADPTVAAAAETLNALLRRTTTTIPNLLLWARLKRDQAALIPPLARLAEAAGGLKPHPTECLELLAWQLHVDFRDVATDDRMLEKFILDSIPWHRLKGTPAAVEQALSLYGIKALCDESGWGDNWAVYELELAEVPTGSQLKNIVRVAEMSAPKRCWLRRVHGQYDRRPIIWDEGPPWDIGFWDDDSGVWDEETGVKESFGQTHAFMAESFSRGLAALARDDIRPARIFYLDRPIWDIWAWDTPTIRSHGFVISELISILGRGLDGLDYLWSGPWGEKPWNHGYSPRERRIHHHRSVSKSQMVWDEADWDNSIQKMDRRRRTLVDNPMRWDCGCWDADRETSGLRELIIDEYFIETEFLATTTAVNGEPGLGQGRLQAFAVQPIMTKRPQLAVTNYVEEIRQALVYCGDRWLGPWGDQLWQRCAYFGVREE